MARKMQTEFTISPDSFAHPNAQVFERSLAHVSLVARNANFDLLPTLSICLQAIDAAIGLGPREQARRAELTLESVSPTNNQLNEIATNVKNYSGPLRNAIIQFLPAALKRTAFGKRTGQSQVAQIEAAPKTQTTGIEPSSDNDAARGQVLLAGTYQEHEINLRFLKQHGFHAVRASTMAEFDSILLNDDIIGIIIAKSWWNIIARDDHVTFVKRICSFSAFTWIKIEPTGFAAPDNFDQICSIARVRPPQMSGICSGASPNISDTDLPILRRAELDVCGRGDVYLYPADIDPQVVRILIAAIGKHVEDRNYPGRVELKQIGTKALAGGRSGASLIHIQPNDGGLPLIAKVAPIESLREEMDRFSKFIKRFDNLLDPQLHFHNGKGAIIFRLVDDAMEAAQPAPTLETKLTDLWWSESLGFTAEDSGTDIQVAIARTIEKLKRLNCEQPGDNTHPNAWVDVNSLNGMDANGVHWDFDPLPNGDNPRDVVEDAILSIETRLGIATIHGDVHLRNVLVRDRDPFLIDYANSGPGHPMFDLVRFESAVLFRCFRMTISEERLRELLQALHEQPAPTLDRLRERFGIACASVTNRIALFSALKCKEACGELARLYDIPMSDYHALKLIIACQSLTMPEFQAGVVRANLWIAADAFRAQNPKSVVYPTESLAQNQL